MRVEPSVRELIDSAANLLNLDRSVFIQAAALREAERVLLDQKNFKLDDAAYDAFDQAMSVPGTPNSKVADLMKRTSPWE